MWFLRKPRDIKQHVHEFVDSRRDFFAGKTVVDCPAGTGITASVLKDRGAQVIALDLFPEFFKVAGLTCAKCNLSEHIPLPRHAADYLICQEGIEHLSDQLRAFREFNRVLKPGGIALITTPNYSNLKSKVSYLLTESEYVHKIMPPNEVDDLWFGGQVTGTYHGHLFLTGVQRLRALAKLAGFTIHRMHATRASSTSLALMFLLYPWIVISSWVTCARNLRKKRSHPCYPEIRDIYREQFKLSIAPAVLLSTHLCIEFIKTSEWEDVCFARFSKYSDTQFVT